MPWKKKKSYNVSNANTNSNQTNIGKYTKTPNNSNSGVVYSLPKQPNTKKLHKIL